ncbi:uncharacterized protein LOC115698603 isoform X1 [Cannabis sativa]|uniref:DUF4042 domain-containing protein n=2 Tax=Cannabis sativa TaxID=3483 RepID=A0A7J6DMM4_CANSA|nr:uncharacterized protein LOC115698603 isoform X1 [Cannabis sativa]KAF4346859.1 hypothetical protein G4B88_015480 [Cannabis sativa]
MKKMGERGLSVLVMTVKSTEAELSSERWLAMAEDLVRAWRTAFLSLRDEILTTPPPTPHLLHQLLFSHSQTLISAAPDLPLHELISDLLFLMELLSTSHNHSAFPQFSRLIHDICHRVPLQLNSSSWTQFLQSLQILIHFFITTPPESATESLLQCFATLRCLLKGYRRKMSSSDDIQLVKFLVGIIAVSHSELTAKRMIINQSETSLWEVQTFAFTMLEEAISRLGSSFSAHLWISTIEVFRKMMDVLASKTTLLEDSVKSRYYAALLHCLHLVLMDPKGSLSDHVSSFVAALRMFFTYGLNGKPQFTIPVDGHKEKELSITEFKSPLEEPKRTDRAPYRPPHLRKKDISAWSSPSFSDHESSRQDFTSDDSDFSDSDASVKDADSALKLRVRIAALDCIKDLCQADSKSFTTQWTLLLPTCDVLQPRKFEASLMTCLLFDPYLKARIASASTLAVMLDGPSSVFLQVAEFKEPSKSGSFTALSISLGHILMQLHTGILYLIPRENHGRLLVSLFKILMLLISSTPYSRMSAELLPTVITSIQKRIEVGFPFRNDQTGLLTASFSCLTAAFTISPSSKQVKEVLLKEMNEGFIEAEKKPGVLFTLFYYLEKVNNHTVCLEALQTLRAVSHNYPVIMFSRWEQVSTMVYGFLRAATPEANTRPWKAHVGNTMGPFGEKIIIAAIKVLDECLRAISGFKGTEDLLEDKLLETPFTSDNIRMKKVSSAPLYEQEISEGSNEYNAGQSGILLWCEALEKHFPLILRHASAMVRAASVTCFAGITSSVFFSLTKEKQDFILSAAIYAAKQDEVPSVRSASCRAIGVISCIPQVFQSAEILNKLIHAVEINTRDPSISVRITASWALANICDSIRHCIDTLALEGSTDYTAVSESVALLTDCALRLSNDGDKIKSNAVRALGNLSRFIRCRSQHGFHGKITDKTTLSPKTRGSMDLPSTSDCRDSNQGASISYHPASFGDSRWFERTVQAFISCVTTGNVKVQWNVCHALSNLFLNETLRLQEMDWASSVFSILLLLLRDSSNFKIKIQAAVALAVPSSVLAYGNSFSDIVKGLVHLMENLGSNQISAPSSFKYRVALENQLTSTLLHILSLASRSEHEPLKDFLVKKASFVEEWLKGVCTSSSSTSSSSSEASLVGNQKKEMICKAIGSLIELFQGINQYAIAHKFQNLLDNNILIQ